MKDYILFAVIAGALWGLGGYIEKTGLRMTGIPPIAGITLRTAVALIILGLLSSSTWKTVPVTTIMTWGFGLIVAGGIIAGAFGMWSFYASLATTENLGVTLALAFSVSPLTGTIVGLLRGDQPMDLRLGLGLLAIIGGILLIQLGHPEGSASATPDG